MTHPRVGDLVIRNAELNPDETTLIEHERSVTCRQLDTNTSRLANALAALGLHSGHADRESGLAVAIPVNYGLLDALQRTDLLHVALGKPGDAQDPLRAFLAKTFHTAHATPGSGGCKTSAFPRCRCSAIAMRCDIRTSRRAACC